jgi:hypothetical protein
MPIDLSSPAKPPTPDFMVQDGVVKILLTYSNTSLYQSCHWKYWIRQVKYLVPKTKELVFSFGQAYHNGIEGYYKTAKSPLDGEALIKAHEIADDLLQSDRASDYDNAVPIKVKSMIRGFVLSFKDSPYEITDQEMPFLVKLPDAPDFELNGVKYEFWVSGKIDAEMKHKPTGALYLGEWKTCTSFDDYMSKIRQDNQPWQYMIGYYLKNRKRPSGVVYRLAKKTLIRQKKSETVDEFFSRIVTEYSENMAEYFKEEIVPFDNKRADRHWNFLYDMAKEIKFSFENDLWSRSHGSCFNYNKPCPYMSICKTDSENDFNMIADSYFGIKPPNEELIEVPSEGS